MTTPDIVVQQAPASPLIAVQPLIPRKRNNNKVLELESLSPAPTSLPGTPDSNKKFWPPQPKLRAATSMVNLTDLDTTESHSTNDSDTLERRTKKPKWYSKLSHTLKLTPQNIKLSGSETNLSKEKDKSKKTIWRRIKLASHN